MTRHDDRREQRDQDLGALLKSSMPPIGAAGLPRDLWSDMLKRIESGEIEETTFGPLDWIVAGLVAGSVFTFPGVILNLLYYL